jgi:hypothetical protein
MLQVEATGKAVEALQSLSAQKAVCGSGIISSQIFDLTNR